MHRLIEWPIFTDAEKLKRIQSILADNFFIPDPEHSDQPVRFKIFIEIDPEKPDQMVRELKECVETGRDPMSTSLSQFATNLENAPYTYSSLAEYVHHNRLFPPAQWPLQTAVRHGHMEVVQFLTKNGAGPHQNKTKEIEEIFVACRNIFLLQYLLELGYPFKKDSLNLFPYEEDIISLKEILGPVIFEKGDFPRLFSPTPGAIFSTGRLEIIKYHVQNGYVISKFWNEYFKSTRSMHPVSSMEGITSTDWPLLLIKKNYLDIFKFVLENINVEIGQLGALTSCYAGLREKMPKENKERGIINETEYYVNFKSSTFFDVSIFRRRKAAFWKQIETSAVFEEAKKWLQTSPFVTHQRIPSELLIQINQVMHLALIPQDSKSTPDFKLEKICELSPLNPFATEYAWWKNYTINQLPLDNLRQAYKWYAMCTQHIPEIHEHDNYTSLHLQSLMNVSPGRDIFSIIKYLFTTMSLNFGILKAIIEYATVHFLTPGLLHIQVALHSKDTCLACMTKFKQVSFFPEPPEKSGGILAPLLSSISKGPSLTQ